MRKPLLAFAAGAMCVFCTNLALAQSSYDETQVGRDQNVVFPDDPLAAGGLGPNDARIHVMPSPKRVTLIRPRTNFVMEMLKSVEAL